MNISLNALLEEFGWRVLDRKSIGDLHFSQLWQTLDDPLPLLVVQESSSETKAIREFVRRIENLAWTLHAHNNRSLLIVIMLVIGDIESRAEKNVEFRLSRFCKIIIIPENAARTNLQAHLVSLNRKLGLPTPSEKGVLVQSKSVRSILLTNPLQQELLAIQNKSQRPEDVRSALENEFARRVSKVIDAFN